MEGGTDFPTKQDLNNIPDKNTVVSVGGANGWWGTDIYRTEQDSNGWMLSSENYDYGNIQDDIFDASGNKLSAIDQDLYSG